MTRRIDRPDTDADRELRSLLDAPEPRSAIVIAGAGSGKTTSLIKALDHVERNQGMALRKRRQKIACITYTNVAVDEIRTDLHNSPLVHAATINSFLWELVNPFQRDIAAWVAKRMAERRAELIKEREGFGPQVRQTTRDRNDVSIARLDEAIESHEFDRHFAYETTSDYMNGLLGHDDVIRMVPELVQTKPLLSKLVAQQYPYCFVDESQDTHPTVVAALKHVASRHPDRFRLYFFGDPMQKIYTTGIGNITLEDGWTQITKAENYRSAPRVLAVINNIRARGDALHQIHAQPDSRRRLPPHEGTARLFVLPADDNRTENLNRVRTWLARRNANPAWLDQGDDGETRTLVIARRMAAARLGYADLFAAFNNGTSAGVSAGFDEGTIWPLAPLLRVVIPLIEAATSGADFELISLLRTACPRLSHEALQSTNEPAALLKSLKRDVENLAKITADSQTTTRHVLRLVSETNLIRLDRRFRAFDLAADHAGSPEHEPTEALVEGGPRVPRESIERFLDCPFDEVLRYHRHLTTQSPYSTQHGVKGAEYPRVLVVLDDAEGRFSQYSYDILLGQKEAKPVKEGGESTAERTLRLFYVCCSRATIDLAVAYFTADPGKAYTDLLAAGLFAPEDIYRIQDLAVE